jgi:hypothetical protein
MSEGTVGEWCGMFRNGWTDFYNEEWSCQSSVVTDDLVQTIEQKICERRHFTILELSCEFPQILPTVLCEIITVRLGFQKFCSRWVSKMLMGVHKIQRMAWLWFF